MGDKEYGDDIVIAPENDTEEEFSDSSGISLPTEEADEDGEEELDLSGLDVDEEPEDEEDGEDEDKDEIDLS